MRAHRNRGQPGRREVPPPASGTRWSRVAPSGKIVATPSRSTNTTYLEDGRLTGLHDGMVPVDDSLAVPGHDNVYAVGDIIDIADPKMATWAQTQAAVVVENLRARLHGRAATARSTPATEDDRRILLPLGPTRGVGQVPGPDGRSAPAPLPVVIDRKGRDLFTARMARRFHAPRGRTPTA